MRRAKIISTLGPSTHSVEAQKELLLAGADIVRINMSHGSYEEHGERIANVRKAAIDAKKEIAVLLDLQGPKIRVGKLENDLILGKDDTWIVGHDRLQKDYPEYSDHFIPTVYEKLAHDTHVGALILFDDGAIEGTVIEKDRDIIKIKIRVGGKLKSKKGINLPDSHVSADCFTEKDQADLTWGIEQKVDYVAISFVRSEKDILKVKTFLEQKGSTLPVIAKIERPEAVHNVKRIAEVADAIMIARGDMGVEVGNHRVPTIQKMIIHHCNEIGKPVITATQMLESMITNSAPTRAEASDVANAIWDGTDVVMLSGETAMGAYPIKVVEMMDRIVKEAEKLPKNRPALHELDLSNITTSLQVAASLVAEKIMAKWIISFSKTGDSCQKISRFRPKTHVLGISNSLETVRRMCLYWGVTPFLVTTEHQKNANYQEMNMIRETPLWKKLHSGDKIVVTYGDGHFFTSGSSNSLRVEVIP